MAQDGSPRRTSLVFPIVLIGLGCYFCFGDGTPRLSPGRFSGRTGRSS